MRMDIAVAARGLAESRSAAASLIKDGCVTVNGAVCVKPAFDVSDSDVVVCSCFRVSRSELKLRRAFEVFDGLSANGKICLDAGASAGGFTRVLLERGADKVYAVDVGTGQLHGSLRTDPRVVSLEQTDIRGFCRSAQTDGRVFDIVTADLSFISLSKVLPYLRLVCGAYTDIVVLIKPQFEVGYRHKGVVRSASERERVLDDIIRASKTFGFRCVSHTLAEESLNSRRNTEYLLYLKTMVT